MGISRYLTEDDRWPKCVEARGTDEEKRDQELCGVRIPENVIHSRRLCKNEWLGMEM